VDDELIRVAGLVTRVACQRMTQHCLKALSDSVEQVCCLSARFAWDRKAMAHAEFVNMLADSAADPSAPAGRWSSTFRSCPGW